VSDRYELWYTRGLLVNQKAQWVGRARARAPASSAFPGESPASRLPLIDVLLPAQRPEIFHLKAHSSLIFLAFAVSQP
jgi:hypothetical protein